MTNQAHNHQLRESQRIRLELAREAERNTVRVAYNLGAVMLTATDRANRLVHVALDDCAIDQLMAQLLEAKRCRKHDALTDDDAPPTRRDGSASTWPAPAEFIDEIRSAT